MTCSVDICIHGAGFVGQTLAALLHRAGLSVALLDTEPSPEVTDIRAFAMNAASKATLESIGAWPDEVEAAVTPVLRMQIHGDAGGALQFDAQNTSAPLHWMVDVPALTHALTHALPRALPQDLTPALSQVSSHPPPLVTPQTSTATAVQTMAAKAALKLGQVQNSRPPSPQARFTRVSSMEHVQAKLHVVCEGRHSKLLAELGVQAQTTVYNQHAVAARLLLDTPHGQCAQQWFNDQGEVLALLPVGGSASCEVALVWSKAPPSAHRLQAAAPSDFLQAVQAATGLSQLQLSSPRALWPLVLKQVHPWCGQAHGMTWALAGDAAHTVHPMAGQGLNLGLADAQALADALIKVWTPSLCTHALLKTLRHCARARKAAAMPIWQVTDGLHLLFAAQNPVAHMLRNWGMSSLNRVAWLKKAVTIKASI